MESKRIIIEGLPTHTSPAKLIFNLIEQSFIKKHHVGRIERFPNKINVELIDYDDDELEKVLFKLQNFNIDGFRASVWSKDVKVDPAIESHFKKLIKWQEAEIEHLDKETSANPFGRFKIESIQRTIHGAWLLDLKQQKVYQGLNIKPKTGQPMVMSSPKVKGHETSVMLLKWSDDFVQVSMDREPTLDDWEDETWELELSKVHYGLQRGLSQLERLPYLLEDPLNSLFQSTLIEPESLKQVETEKLNQSDLNDVQQKAYEQSLLGHNFQLIQGPPGTGKSKVLLAILKLLNQQEKRVLVVAASNSAVDHLLMKCEINPEYLLRLGHISRIDPKAQYCCLEEKWRASESHQIVTKLKKEHQKIKSQLHKVRGEDKKQIIHELKLIEENISDLLISGKDYILNRSPIVFATHTGFQPFLLRGQKFDVVLVDEAAQCTEVDLWLTLPWGKRWILAGDPSQLPAVVKSSKAKELSVSLMERLIKKGVYYHLLEEQYRMHEQIAQYSSDTFYQSSLMVGHEDQNKTLEISDKHDHLFWALSPHVFIDTAGSESEELLDEYSYYNQHEAQFIMNRVNELIDVGFKADQIGVIAPYRAQCDLLNKLSIHTGIEIKSIDSFQGREKDIIFISCVRTNTEQTIGFLRDIRRMNVAMTRARKLLVLVGDSATLSSHDFYQNYLEWKESEDGFHSIWEWT